MARLSSKEKKNKCVALRRLWIEKEFKTSPCNKCGISYPPYVMDFHHRDPSTKLFSISHGAYHHSRIKLIEEISKCDLVCANCHRVIEHEYKLMRVSGQVP